MTSQYVTIHLKTAWSNQAGKMIRPAGKFAGYLTANETFVTPGQTRASVTFISYLFRVC